MQAPTSLSGMWLWIAAVLVGLVGFEILRHWVGKTVTGLRHRWIARRAIRGEAHAEDLLADAGYAVVDRQVERAYVVRIDGLATRVLVRADLLVRNARGQTMVAEVKTGREAPRIENSATRRQLLEYRVAFDTPGVLLVDAETDSIREVQFPVSGESPSRKPKTSWPRLVALGAALGLAGALGLIAALHQLGLPLP